MSRQLTIEKCPNRNWKISLIGVLPGSLLDAGGESGTGSIKDEKMKNIKTIRLLENSESTQQYSIKKILRKAKNEGDTENINHTQFSRLKQFGINFKELHNKEDEMKQFDKLGRQIPSEENRRALAINLNINWRKLHNINHEGVAKRLIRDKISHIDPLNICSKEDLKAIIYYLRKITLGKKMK